MQRFLGPVVGVLVVFFAFNFIVTQNSGKSLPEVFQEPTPTATSTVEPAPADGTDPAPAPPAVSDTAQQARAALETVALTPNIRIRDYDRKAQFTPGGKGTSWPDVDGNGCDTRNDILARDLTDTYTEDGCTILTGTLNDPYTGTSIAFERDIYVDGKKVGGNSKAVEIDHVISLKNAWASGASEWTQDERVLFANDPLNLIASDGPANSSKGASSASEWMPADAGNAAYNCSYATTYTTVLVKYGLTATGADLDALRATLEGC